MISSDNWFYIEVNWKSSSFANESEFIQSVFIIQNDLFFQIKLDIFVSYNL